MEKKGKSREARRKYDDGFKNEALTMIRGGRSVPEVARALGISENLLYKWRAGQEAARSPEAQSHEGELEALRKQLRQVETERDILKKALAIFGRTT